VRDTLQSHLLLYGIHAQRSQGVMFYCMEYIVGSYSAVRDTQRSHILLCGIPSGSSSAVWDTQRSLLLLHVIHNRAIFCILQGKQNGVIFGCFGYTIATFCWVGYSTESCSAVWGTPWSPFLLFGVHKRAIFCCVGYTWEPYSAVWDTQESHLVLCGIHN
jgi:hypothetical protein